jgi:hypothetical protein
MLLQLKGGPKSITPAEIYSILEAAAIDMNDIFTATFDTGYDYATGWSLVSASAALNSMNVIPLPTCGLLGLGLFCSICSVVYLDICLDCVKSTKLDLPFKIAPMIKRSGILQISLKFHSRFNPFVKLGSRVHCQHAFLPDPAIVLAPSTTVREPL